MIIIARYLLLGSLFLAFSHATRQKSDAFSTQHTADTSGKTNMDFMVGAPTEARDADAEIQAIADKVRGQVEGEFGKPGERFSFKEFTAISYTSQVVAGINYFIKVRVADNEYIHIRVYRDLQQNVSLAGYEKNKTLEDPITYF